MESLEHTKSRILKPSVTLDLSFCIFQNNLNKFWSQSIQPLLSLFFLVLLRFYLFLIFPESQILELITF